MFPSSTHQILPGTPGTSEETRTHRFGVFVFDDSAMEQRLPASAYHKMRDVILKGGTLDPAVADAVAFGMKVILLNALSYKLVEQQEWAIEKGATCFTHWFQPLSDKSARKYDSFVTPKHHVGFSCEAYEITQFTGKQLIQGEPDGSSFPRLPNWLQTS